MDEAAFTKKAKETTKHKKYGKMCKHLRRQLWLWSIFWLLPFVFVFLVIKCYVSNVLLGTGTQHSRWISCWVCLSTCNFAAAPQQEVHCTYGTVWRTV